METGRIALKTAALATAGVIAIELIAHRAIAAGALPPLAWLGLARAAGIILMSVVAAATA